MGVDISSLSTDEASAAGRAAILELVHDLEQPHRLRDVGVEPDDFPALAKDALEGIIALRILVR